MAPHSADPRRTGSYLVVDDETGIREGLAGFVRLRGHRVLTASTLDDAVDALSRERFDAVVTDWRLDETPALPVIENALRAETPCLVISGHPDEVVETLTERRIEIGDDAGVVVLEKPMLPSDLVERLERAGESDRDDGSTPMERAEVPDLPVDTASRVDLVRRICGSVDVDDDGTFVRLRAPLQDDEDLDALAACGGDLRVLSPDVTPIVEIRLYRDGRPEGVDLVLRSGDAWPDDPGVSFAIDLDGDECGPRDFGRLVAKVRNATAAGRSIDLLNVPDALRIWLEASDRDVRLPMRREPGPRLPDEVVRLWS